MDEDDEAGQLHNFAPDPVNLLKRIRELAQNSKNVAFYDHAEERMEERGISDLDALRVLRTGQISGPITPGRNEGEWKCKVVAPVKGRREVGVAVLTIHNRRLRVKTVEWEDLK